MRVALVILEHSHLLGRETAVLSKQKVIADLDGRFDEAQVARALQWLTDKEVIEHRIEGYVFRPPPWKAPLRTAEGSRRTRQMEMDLWIDKVEAQIELKFEADLNETLRQRFIESSGLVGATSSPVGATSRPALKLVGATSSPVGATSRHMPHTTMVPVHGRYSMDHAIRTIGVKAFEVGALGKKTGQEIFDEVIKQTGPLKPDHLESLWRRIEEAPKLIWELATEAKQRHDIGNKAGWINRGYMKQMHLGRYAERAS